MLFTALAVLAVVGLIILIRKGGGAALATAAPAVALGVVRANRRRGSAGSAQRADRHGFFEGPAETGREREGRGHSNRVKNRV